MLEAGRAASEAESRECGMSAKLGMAYRQLRFAASVAHRRPFDICVQLTNRCTMRCDFCHFWSLENNQDQELSVLDYERISGELSRLGCLLVSLEGGEPLCRPDLAGIVRVFARHHLPVVYTNGWLVTPSIAATLFDAGLTQVGVSIDYPDGPRHDARRGIEGAHERAWEAVDILRSAAPNGGAQVHVMTVLMDDNQDDIETLLQMSLSRGVGHHLTLLSDRRRTGNSSAPRRPRAPLSDQLLRLRDKYDHLATFREYLGLVDAFLAGDSMPRCRMGRQMFNIGATGDVTPCNEKLSWVVGNVRDTRIETLHRRLAEMDEVAQCQDCWLLCRGFSYVLGSGGSLKGWVDLARRMRSR